MANELHIDPAIKALWTYELAELANFGRPAILLGASPLTQSVLGAAFPVTLAVALSPLAFVCSRRIALSSLTTRPALWSAGIADRVLARLPTRKALHWWRAGLNAAVDRIAGWLRVLCS